MLQRDAYRRLVEWKASSHRKPLLLRGARQTGKTFLLQEFGRRDFERTVYCNFEDDPALGGFFQRDLSPDRILSELSLYKGLEIRPEGDLIVFDEIQACNRALTSLKYFHERASEFHVAAAGSLLGVKMAGPGSFPVGQVSFVDLHPMSFLEFLEAMGVTRYRSLLEGLAAPEPLPDAIHADLVDWLRKYCFVGGMPEVVAHFISTNSADQCRVIQKDIVDSYVLDFAKHAPTSDIPKLSMIWDSIPRHLGKDNKKFMFAAVKKGARGRDYENALRWLVDAGLVHLCHAVSTARSPLAHYADKSCFKAYALDVGLVGAMVGSPTQSMVQGDRLFSEYAGSLAENYVAQQLVACGSSALYYWRSSGGKAELDFLVQSETGIVPLEVKAGINPKSKSLRSYEAQFHAPRLLRTTLLNLRLDGNICNVPLYAVPVLSKFTPSGESGGP